MDEIDSYDFPLNEVFGLNIPMNKILLMRIPCFLKMMKLGWGLCWR